MRETLYDYQGLFNCLRPDEQFDRCPPDETMVADGCDYCKSYNGEKPVARFVMKDLISGHVDVTDLCSDCINQDSVFLNKKIIETINF